MKMKMHLVTKTRGPQPLGRSPLLGLQLFGTTEIADTVSVRASIFAQTVGRHICVWALHLLQQQVHRSRRPIPSPPPLLVCKGGKVGDLWPKQKYCNSVKKMLCSFFWSFYPVIGKPQSLQKCSLHIWDGMATHLQRLLPQKPKNLLDLSGLF